MCAALLPQCSTVCQGHSLAFHGQLCTNCAALYFNEHARWQKCFGACLVSDVLYAEQHGLHVLQRMQSCLHRQLYMHCASLRTSAVEGLHNLTAAVPSWQHVPAHTGMCLSSVSCQPPAMRKLHPQQGWILNNPPVPCRQAAQDRRLMCPMAGAENHPRCRRNEQGQPLLVNGVAWQQYLMLLMMSTKLLTECDKVLKVRAQPRAAIALVAGSKLSFKRRVLCSLCGAFRVPRARLTVLHCTACPCAGSCMSDDASA